MTTLVLLLLAYVAIAGLVLAGLCAAIRHFPPRDLSGGGEG